MRGGSAERAAMRWVLAAAVAAGICWGEPGMLCEAASEAGENEGAPAGGEPSITLALAGDTMLGRLAGQAILERGPDYPRGDAWGQSLISH